MRILKLVVLSLDSMPGNFVLSVRSMGIGTCLRIINPESLCICEAS